MNANTSAIAWARIMEMEKKEVLKTETSKSVKPYVSTGNKPRESHIS